VLPGTPMDVIDIDPKTHEEISSLGCRPLRWLDRKCVYDLVAGCTGYASFPLSQRSLLADGAVLVSGSSAAIEFNREKFIELADASPDDEIEVLDREVTRRKGIHATITLRQEGGKRFSFLNSSYPINFDGSLECLTIPAIQPTHCLMVAAARQAIRGKMQGLHPIHPIMDEWIFQHGVKSLAAHYQ